MKKNIKISKELYYYREDYNVNSLNIYLIQEDNNIKLYKCGGQLFQSVMSVLDIITEDSDNQIEYIGETQKKSSIFKINGEIYKVDDYYYENSNTRAVFTKYKGKYVYIKEYNDIIKKDINDFR